MKWFTRGIFFIFSISFLHSRAQEIILPEDSNRFLLNQTSDRPRLEVIVQRFTEYEKTVLSKTYVMDTLTKPRFKRISDQEYVVKASRMGEKLTFVIRNLQGLKPGYWVRLGNKRWEQKGSAPLKYRLGGEECLATMDMPFGMSEENLDLMDKENQLLYRLRLSFTYLSPQLYYVDMEPHFNLTNTVKDTVLLRKFGKWVSPAPVQFTDHTGGVPKKVRRYRYELYFGFKPVYYDGAVHPSTVICKIDQSAWRGTPRDLNPYTFIYYHFRKEFDWLYDGEHHLYARYGGPKSPELVFAFEVKNVLISTIWYWFRNFFWLIFMMFYSYPWLTGVIVVALIYFIFKRKLKAANEKAKRVNLELQSIQSQLNPHFVFNALGSIQGLINQNEIESANSYLTDFSKLLRKSLNNNGKELIPLSEELYLVEHYVKLEKLRFNFNYDLEIDERLQITQIEIPSLLIQPVIENAIKHGISGMDARGLLSIHFLQVNDDLVVKVQDNGAGFEPGLKSTGKGLELTRERIKLLNRQSLRITMELTSTMGQGTSVKFEFKNFC